MPTKQIIPYESIMDSIADGVFTVDLDWNITFFNKAAERITGVACRQAIGRKCWDVFHSSICDGACAVQESLDAQRNVGNKTIFIVKPGGEKTPVAISAAPLIGASGEIVGGVETFRDVSAIHAMRQKLEGLYTLEDIITKSHTLIRILNLLPRIAQSDATVLLLGESGVGKELFARAVHNLSMRKKGPFTAVNCAALPDNLLESELFGYKAGAFTDAKTDKPGRFALADRGAIFLDEIGDMPLPLQSKLLRVLQEKTFEPLGGVKSVKSDARVIAATNRDLAVMVAEGKFRDDLFYRLNVVQITIPPLRERPEDIPLLINHFIKIQSRITGKDIEGVSEDVHQLLLRRPYPGNVRELENIIEYAFILCPKGFIQLEHLPDHVLPAPRVHCAPTPSGALKDLKYQAALDAVRRHGGRKMAACRELGVSKDTLRRILARGGVETK